ncbi:hypothetical protein [Thauera sp. 2A1]|uniref:hypothetical protein n=1 Tax=Thauera sp. 2A1 TaxID=2570191 RepID=UPI0012919342|nr:hypothetical protein [Thauera sp. 2A1]KAI5913244.1 hypothetical protein GH664_18495 [Thauera sp. 2A1]
MNVLLELLIGLALLYLLTAVVASFVVEAVASYLKLRAKGLESCIAQLVEGAANRAGGAQGADDNWTSRFYGHALIRALSTARVMTADSASRPSYIPREQYAEVLLDLVRKAAGLAPGESLTVARLREIVATPSVALPAGVRAMIETALTNGADSLDKVRASMEAGFDAAMERASGWYKRRTQLWLALFAFVFAAVFNLDSFYIGSRLLKDEALRATALQMSVDAVTGEEAKSPERFAAVVGSWAVRMRDDATQVAPHKASANKTPTDQLKAAGTRDATALALRMMHDANHWNPLLANAAWPFLTATALGARSKALAAALPELSAAAGQPCGESPLPQPVDAAPLADWVQYLRCPRSDGVDLDTAIERFRKSAVLWAQTDRVINPTLGRLLARAVVSDQGNAEMEALKTYLAALDADTKKFADGVDTALAKLPEVGWIGEVSAGWDGWRTFRAVLGWLATAIMAGLGAPFWFDLLGKLVSLRGAGRKPAAQAASG